MFRHRSVRLRILLFVAATTVGAPRALAQSPSPDFNAIAERLAAAIPRTGSVRVAVVPLTRGELPDSATVAARATTRLDEALAAQPTAHGRSLTIVSGPDVDRAADGLGLPRPLGPMGALLVGAVLEADYVVVGTADLTQDDAVVGLSVEMLDVQARTPVGRAQYPASGGSPDRWLLTVGGFGGAALAAWMGVSSNRDVIRARSDLLALPAGATDEWNAEYARALTFQRARLIWWSTAVGAAGATAAYLVFGHSTSRRMETTSVFGIRVPTRWSVVPSRAGPGLLVTTSF